MKKFLAILAILSVAIFAQANSLSVISEMESNLTAKLRGIVTPVDPDAIVMVNISVRKISTALPTTGMEALNFFGSDTRHTVESNDIDSVKVSVYSSLDPFPADIRGILENSLKLYAKKGELTVAKLDAKTTEIFKKRDEVANQRTEELKKVARDYSEQSQRLVYILAGAIGIAILLAGIMVSGFMRGGMGRLSKGFSEIKIDTGGGGGMTALPPPSAETSSTGGKGGGFVAGGAGAARLDDMRVESLLSLLVDCYWCEKDAYAHWMWTQISPGKKSELLTAWAPLASYVDYFTHQNAMEDRFHNDPYYLGSAHFQQVSNSDLETSLREDMNLWASMSSMRKESLKLTLKERLDLREMESRGMTPSTRSLPPSAPRHLPAQIEIRELSEEDERLMFQEPYRIGAATARRLPSWVWVALLPRDERASVLNAVSAQAIAECWVGPEDVLRAVLEVMPEKKRNLFDEYRAKVQPRRGSPWLKSLSEAAIAKLDFSAPAEAASNSEYDQNAA